METSTNAELANALRDLLLVSGARAGSRRVPTADDLDEVIVERVQRRLDELAPSRDRSGDRLIAWGALVEAVRADDKAPVADKKLLVAAAHLLAKGRDPRDPTKDAPYSDRRALLQSVGLNDTKLETNANVRSRGRYETGVTFRRYYATVASGLGSTVDTLRPDKALQARYIGGAVLRALESRLADGPLMHRLLTEHAPAPVAVSDSGQDSAQTDATPNRHLRRTIVTWSIAGITALTVLVVVLVFVWPWAGAPEAGALDAPPAVDVESVASEPPKWTMNTSFWVPESAPLEELDGITDGCENQRARDWLTMHGIYRHPLLFRVTNTSDQTIGISEVASRGTSSLAKPGLIVQCSGGGEGGEIDWSVLELTVGEDSVATLSDPSRVSRYFWRDIASGESAGVLVYPSGEKDFSGSITVDVTPVSGEPGRVAVPALEGDGARTIEWHGMPSDKSIVFTLPSADGTATCEVNGAALDTCSARDLRAALKDLWSE